MSRKQHADGGAISQYSPGRGPETIIIHTEFPLVVYDVLRWLTWLSYPGRSDSLDRGSFAKALDSWRCKGARAYLGCWKQLPAEIRGMTNRSIEGKLHMGLKRIAKRLTAGSIALALYIKKDRPMPGFNPSTRSGIGIVSMGPGVGTVTEGLEKILKQKGEVTGWRYDRNEAGKFERDAIENHRNVIWTESLPVLHMAVTLHCWLRNFPSDARMWAEVYRLICDPRWLGDALVYAEDWRVLLDRYRIPSFDKDKAIRLIRAD